MRSKTVEGIVDMAVGGFAFVISEQTKEDIYINPKNLGRALDGDKVKVSLHKSGRRRRRQEGKIIELIERAQTVFLGIVHISKNFAFVVPDKKNMPVDIGISLDKLNGAKQGDKVVAEIIDWTPDLPNPLGEITNLLGKPGDNDVEMKSILLEHGFKLAFPKKVLKQTEQISESISQEEIKKRKDFRQVPTFTIDPEDAKDFDDALSIRQLSNGNWEVGIHIADVSHYVQPQSPLDKEAYKRSTSVYLVDRVLSMLPEKLSNGVCSLRPNEEKLCFAAVFELNQEAIVLNQWFGKTIILSDKRFTYEQAQQVIETKKGDFADELKILNQLAYKLREEKFKNGAIAFETTEVKFKVKENGVPIEIYIKERKDAHLLIEDFMLLANKKVAEFVSKNKSFGQNVPFVYRVHDSPDIDKLTDFALFATQFGYQLNISTPKHIARSLNQLMKDVVGKPEQNVLEQLAIRSMAKALYTTQNIGHYGLGFKHYTHFTSPIRRYPDIMVHRILAQSLANHPDTIVGLEEKCRHTSEMEKRAMEAERDSIKYKQVEFMQSRVGEVFDAIISGVVERGLFVEIIENKCEGFVPADTLQDDDYQFKQKDHSFVGMWKDKKLQLGGQIKIKVIKADLLKRRLDFEIVNG